MNFDQGTGTLTHSGVSYATSDCSDAGQTLIQESGAYTLGDTIDCANGSNFQCRELDIAWESGSGDYGVYSVDESSDPDLLLLSHLESAQNQRPLDVDPSLELRRILFPDKTGRAILDLYLVDGGYSGSPPQPQAGYALLPYDLNEGSGGHYIWLYYLLGRANGADGTPLGEIYTVNEGDGEKPRKGGTKLPVNLNAGPIVGHELWLYKITATSKVMRSVVVANPTDGAVVYGPAGTAGLYNVVWVEELYPDAIKSPHSGFPPDVQDLNEGEGIWTDYIYIGYGTD